MCPVVTTLVRTHLLQIIFTVNIGKESQLVNVLQVWVVGHREAPQVVEASECFPLHPLQTRAVANGQVGQCLRTVERRVAVWADRLTKDYMPVLNSMQLKANILMRIHHHYLLPSFSLKTKEVFAA